MAAPAPMAPADTRKLRAIYAALESHNNKQALKLIKAFLERHSGSPLGVALSAVALEREGRSAEASQALDRLIALKPREPQIINTAAPTLKALGRLDDLTALWVNAAEAEPNNEEFQTQLFLAHGRANAYAKQSQMAATLYKTFKRPRYLFWMAGTAYLHWRASQGKESLQLSLAAKWAAKAADECAAAPPAEALTPTVLLETVLFTVELHEALGSLEPALALLAKHSSLFKSEPVLLLRAQASLLTRLGRVREVNEAQRAILESSPDDWEACAALIGSLPHETTETEHHDQLRKFFAALLERAPEPRRRGPLLATILLEITILERASSSKTFIPTTTTTSTPSSSSPDSSPAPPPPLSVAPLCAALKAYLSASVNRPSVLPDLSSLLLRVAPLLSSSELLCVADTLLIADSAAAELAHLLPLPLEQLPRSLHPPPLSLAAARRALSVHLRAPASERHLAAPLLFNAIAAATAAQQPEPLARISLFLLKLYHLCGAGPQAMQCVASLALKHIQWLSMPFVFLDETIELVLPAAAPHDAFKSIAKFAADAKRDMPDLAGAPFRHDSFSKLREFARMREKLEHSLAAHEAAVDAALLSLSETPALSHAAVQMQMTPLFAAPMSLAEAGALLSLSDRSVLPHISPFVDEQTALVSVRFSAPEQWRRAIHCCRSLVGPFLRHLSLTPVPDQLLAFKTLAAAALAQAEGVPAPPIHHPFHRGARLLVHLLELSLALLASKSDEEDEKLTAAVQTLSDTNEAGFAAWNAPHSWWGGERLRAARRWQAEEMTWTTLALQCWLKMVPRKTKTARSTLRKLHTSTTERLGRAVEALKWVEWPSSMTNELSKEAAQAASLVAEAQKNAVNALRNAVTAIRNALQEVKP